MEAGLISYVLKRLGVAVLMLFGVSAILMEDAPYAFLYFPQQVYVTRQGYEGFVPIPVYPGIYQSLKSVRWTGTPMP